MLDPASHLRYGQAQSFRRLTLNNAFEHDRESPHHPAPRCGTTRVRFVDRIQASPYRGIPNAGRTSNVNRDKQSGTARAQIRRRSEPIVTAEDRLHGHETTNPQIAQAATRTSRKIEVDAGGGRE